MNCAKIEDGLRTVVKWSIISVVWAFVLAIAIGVCGALYQVILEYGLLPFVIYTLYVLIGFVAFVVVLIVGSLWLEGDLNICKENMK